MKRPTTGVRNAGVAVLLAASLSFSFTINGADAPQQLNGVPLGGVGTGKFMLTPAGTFSQVTLDGDVIHSNAGGYVANPAGAFFAVYTKGATAWSSKLTTATGMHINYTAYFPKATITYTHPSLPIALTLDAFSPFIPGNKDAYSLPAAIFIFTLTNTTAAALDAAVAFSWQGAKSLTARTNLTSGTTLSGIKGVFIGGNYAIRVRNDSAATTSVGSNFSEFQSGGAFTSAASGDVIAAASKMTLAPGEKRKVTMVFSWYLPSYTLAGDPNDFIGHWYANKFRSSDDIAQFASDSADAYLAGVNKWQGRILNSTLPNFLKDMLCNNMYIMNTLVCLGKDGRYSMSEGLGYTWMGTLDQRFVGTLPVLVFAKDCEYAEMKLFAKNQDASGQIWHDVGNKRISGPCGYGCQMVELSSKFALMVYRNYLWTGDRDSLAYFWPKVQLALQCQKNRANPSTLLLGSGQQTYDCTIFASAYANDIWMASLLAGVEMAKVMGDTASASLYSGWYATVKRNYEGLWNDQYGFYQMESGDATCMYDQLTGQMYADMLSLGTMHPLDHIQRAADYIPQRLGDKYGLKNGLRPDGTYPSGICCGGEPNCTWPGYPPAGYCAMAIYNGKADAGLQSLYSIYNGIYRVNKTVWHQECKEYTNSGIFYEGNIHYMNLMAVWHVLYALTGLNIDVDGKRLWVKPNLPSSVPYMSSSSLTAPIAFPVSWGDMKYQQGATPNDQCITVRFDVPQTFSTIYVRNTLDTPTYSVYVAGVADTLGVTATKNGDELALHFSPPIVADSSGVQIVMPAGSFVRVINGNGALRPNVPPLRVTGARTSGLIITYALASGGPVLMEIFSLQGRRVASQNIGAEGAGLHSVLWEGRPGMYIVKLSTPSGEYLQKATITR